VRERASERNKRDRVSTSELDERVLAGTLVHITRNRHPSRVRVRACIE